jgi:cysteine-rich repeat protein
MYKFLLPLCFLSVGCPGGLCGDNSLDEGEACDDGNTNNADGCEANCSLPTCQNNIVDPGEVCFFAPLEFETDFSPQEVVAADFDGNGVLDLVTANAGLSLSVLLGDGLGGFSRLPEIEVGQVTSVVAVGDFDADSVLDLAASFSLVNQVGVFRGIGSGLFEPLVTLPVFDPASLVVEDFNGDQRPDLVSSSGTGVEIFLNNGAGGFLPSEFFSAVSSVADLAAGDFNGDGLLDLVATYGTAEDALRVLLGDGDGNFTTQAPQLNEENSGGVLAEDFNGDTFLDVVVSRFSASEIGFLAGTSIAALSEVQTLSVLGPIAIAAGDVNGDGFLDVAATSAIDQQTRALAVFLGSEAGSFASPLFFPVGLSDLRGLAFADFNKDGALDAVLTDQSFSRVFVFLSEP